MAKIKYFLEYSDINGIISRLEIWDKDFLGDSTEINGNVTLNYAERKDLLQYSAPASLDINLEADEDITLQDLYSEAENQYQTKFFIDGQLVFFGILKPDGIWEDWVNDKWEMSIDGMDGLSILKELSFVKDDGTFYTGKITEFDALKQILHRIGYDLPINISDDLPTYSGFSSSDSILHNVQMNADRFYQDAQKNNIMNCEEVLKSILEPYNATIFQMNGEWWVVRSLDFKAVMNFKKYDGLVKTDVVWSAEYFIGSDVNNFPIHHANANQKRSVNPSAQAFRVNYKYGTVKSLISNPEIRITSPLISDGWDIESISGKVKENPNGFGIYIEEEVDDVADVLLISSTELIPIKLNDVIDVTFQMEFRYLFITGNVTDANHFLVYTFETANYVLIDNGTWVLKSSIPTNPYVEHYFSNPNGFVNDTVGLPSAPENSNLVIKFYLRELSIGPVLTIPGGYAVINFYLHGITVTPSQSGNFKGEFHTAQRSTRISSVTKSDKTVSVGDSLSDIYLGTLYKSDGEPTELWNRSGMTDNKGLLRLMVEDTLRIAPRPMMYFEGDIYGYIPYMALIDIDNNEGKYQISKYSYNSAKGINRTAFKEFSTDLLAPEDYRYEFEYDYGNVTTVTIKS